MQANPSASEMSASQSKGEMHYFESDWSACVKKEIPLLKFESLVLKKKRKGEKERMQSNRVANGHDCEGIAHGNGKEHELEKTRKT